MKSFQAILLAAAATLVGVSSGATQNFTGAIYGIKAPSIIQQQWDFSGLGFKRAKRSLERREDNPYPDIYKMDTTCLNPEAMDPAIHYDRSEVLATILDYSCVAQKDLCHIAMKTEALGADQTKCDAQLSACRKNYGNTSDQPPPKVPV